MLKFLDLKDFTTDKTPITSTQFLTRDNEFHPEGLFSEEIFGFEGSKERRTTFSYIDLNCNVIHPSGYKLLKQLDRKILTMLSTEKYFSLDSENRLVEDEKNGVTGIESFKNLFPKIKFRGETDTREKYIKKLKQSFNDETLFINYIPVIPPDFRPAYEDENGQWIIDSLNDIYLSILRKSFQVGGSGKGELFDLLNYDMQNMINKHDDFIRDKLGKKHGAIRNLTLGKRADFTGRGVITPGPDLKGNEVGLPFRMVVKLFEPFILHVILRTNKIDSDRLNNELNKHLGEELSVDSLQRVLNSIKNDDDVPKTIYDLIWEAGEIAIYNRAVIAKRDPVLHQESLRSFYVRIVDGNVIRIPTTVVGGFGADFDGDSIKSNIFIFNINENNLLKYKLEDLKHSKLFKLNGTKEKNTGIIVEKYEPQEDLEIESINPKTGEISYNKITEYSVHKNVDLYKISNKNFETFWASSDHSMIIYDEIDKEIKKISPTELLNNPKGKYLIQKEN
ncbi:MAG: hypothetical protein K9L74_05640 [Candidatus Izimaplasma sp.]|nr:hypothetical protein [Candidatus Izimaplasma bacterium]